MREERIIFDVLKNLGCDGVLITDGKGDVVFIEEAFFHEVGGLSPQDLIGKSAFELEKSGVIKPALAIRVMETRGPVTLVSGVKGLYNNVGEAFPILDEAGEIKYIATFSRNMISERQVMQLYDEMLERFKRDGWALPGRPADEDDWIVREGLCTFNESFSVMLKRIEKVAPYDVAVLLTGDTGTGKTMLAKKIHMMSGRGGSFVELNCGAISEALIESELYGYEPGAFTGAEKAGKKGLVEVAGNGTLFLDEISEMPLHLQVKLLHFLQEKRIRRVGGTRDIEVNCRVISATNKDLVAEVAAGRFRKDLFYRLDLASFHIPPLCQRFEDIVPLAKNILRHLSEKYEQDYVLDYDVISLFIKYPWPGNVRELENTIHRMALMSEDAILRSDLLPKDFIEAAQSQPGTLGTARAAAGEFEPADLRQTLESVEKEVICRAWNRYGSSTKVAAALNIGQTTAARKIRKYVKTDGAHRL